MSIVVADASPFVGLIKIGHVEILQGLFARVYVPPQVIADLAKLSQANEVQAFAANPPQWLIVQTPIQIKPIANIDAGEEAAINLALELRADVILIDEKRGRDAAIERGLVTARTAAVIADAADAGILPDLQQAFYKLRATNFRVPTTVLDALLARHLSRRAHTDPP